MYTIKILKSLDFFNQIDKIIDEGKKLGVLEIAVAVSPPSIEKMSLVLTTSPSFNIKKQAEFGEFLNKLFGGQLEFSLFEQSDVEELVNNKSSLAGIYACLLEQSISLKLFSPNESLEEQCKKRTKKLGM